MPMLRRVLRAALFAGVVVLVWTFARSASAAVPAEQRAPFCDDRGASAIAPPPTIESPSDVLERVRAANARCVVLDDDGIVGRAFAPAPRAFHPPASASVHALWRAAPTVTPPTGTDLATDEPPAPVAVEVRLRIERPPRG
jgi:hypothetical protein